MTPDEFENNIDNEIRELAHWFGGWDDFKKKIAELEQADMEAAYERSHYEGDGNFADNH